MSRRVGVVSVDFEAGTAKFNSQVNAAKANMVEFGKHGVSNVQATSAALRVMEGNMTNNLRAAEKFLATLPGVGAAMRAAFPIVGAVAFLGVIGEMGKKMYDFVKNVQEAPAKFNAAFGSMSSAIRMSNDELSLVNAKLEADIAKLEGKRENNLSIALLEAKASADKLAESLDVDLEKLEKLLKEQSGGFAEKAWDRIAGNAPTSDIAEEIKQFRAKSSSVGTDSLGMAFRAHLYQQESARVASELDAAIAYQTAYDAPRKPGYDPTGRTTGTPGPLGGFQNNMSITGDMSKRITVLRDALQQLGAESSAMDLQRQNAGLTSTKEKLTADAANKKADSPLGDRLKSLDAQISGLDAKLKAIGAPESAQILSKAFGEAAKAIEETNKELESHGRKLSAAGAIAITAKETIKASKDAEIEWGTKLAASTVSIDDRIRSQQALTAAIGKGYEATKAANVETRLAQELGQHLGDQEWMGKHAGDVSALRGRFGAEYDAQNQTQVGESLQRLQDQIGLEKDLAAVQAQGAEAVRGVTLAHRLADIARSNDAVSAKRLMASEMELYANERQNATAEEVAKINQKVEATDRLAAATLKGADAIREASLANKLAEIQKDGDSVIPGVIGVGRRGAAAIGEDASDSNLKVAQAGAAVNRIQQIQDRIRELNQVKEKTLDIDIAIRDLENQQIKAIADQALAVGGVQNGMRAFVDDMVSDWRNASQQMARTMYDALHGTVDGIAGELAKMGSGNYHKGGFGQMFKGQGESMLKSTIGTVLHSGIGAIAKHFGFGGTGKPDGSSANPFHVVMGAGNAVAGAASAAGGVIGKAAGWLGNLLHIGPGHASGGAVDPGTVYPVGEQGIEYFAPKVPGTIIPNGGLGGGGDLHIHVDARGAEVGVEARVAQAIHTSAVGNALRANAEHMRRTPRRG